VARFQSRRLQSDVLTGLLTYIAIFGLTTVWILGWMGLSVVAGSFFGLPLKTVTLVGATLGPLGFIVTVAIGILESGQRSSAQADPIPFDGGSIVPEFEDPFS